MSSGVSVEVNMTTFLKGTTFKVFTNGSKLGEISGWDVFFGDGANGWKRLGLGDVFLSPCVIFPDRYCLRADR